ncbi:MAG: hypothetical protein ACRCW9_06450 [Cetobacterium sp.]
MINIKSYDEKEEKLFKVVGLKNKTVLLWCEEAREFKNLTASSKNIIEYYDEAKTKGYETKKIFISYKTKTGKNEIDITEKIKKYLSDNFDI